MSNPDKDPLKIYLLRSGENESGVTSDIQVLKGIAAIHREDPLQALFLDSTVECTEYPSVLSYCNQQNISHQTLSGVTVDQKATDISSRCNENHWRRAVYLGKLETLEIIANVLQRNRCTTEIYDCPNASQD